jgi:hypothetical protein
VSVASLARLELLASAIAGRQLVVTAASPGESSWTDGNLVYVDDELSHRDQVLGVAVQAALVGSGSVAPEIVGRLDRRGPVVGRYLTVEGHRALAASLDVLPPAVCALVDRSFAARSSSPTESLEIAKGKEPVPVAPGTFGTIHPRRVHAPLLDEGEGDDGRAAATMHVPRRSRDEVLSELDDGEETEIGAGLDLLNPVGGSGAVGRLLQRLLGTSRSTGNGEPGAEGATHRSNRRGRPARGASVSSTRVDSPGDVEVARPAARTYPEWNVHRHRYRPDWCTVVETPAVVSGSELGAVAQVQPLRRSLARLGLDLQRRRRQQQGDDIDIDAVVDARVQLAAGSAPDEAIYIDSARTRRELSVLILLDISQSGSEPSGSGGTVHDHQRATAAALTQALHELGDRVALYGFRSQGRQAVHVTPVKRFDDRFDSRTLRRLDGLTPGAYTRLGAAIRHGSSVLETDGGTARRLLLVVSDGFAYDHGYEGAYAEADARRALAEARRRGTACLCLSVGAGSDADALRRVFGTSAHASFPSLDRVPQAAGPLFRTAVRLAEVQRRASQRNERTRERLHIERRSA